MSNFLSALRENISSLVKSEEDEDFIYFWEDYDEEVLILQKRNFQEILKQNQISIMYIVMSILTITLIIFSSMGNLVISLLTGTLLIGLIIFSFYMINQSFIIPQSRMEKSVIKMVDHDLTLDEDFVFYKTSLPVLANLEDYRMGMVNFIKTSNNDIKTLTSKVNLLQSEYNELKSLFQSFNEDMDQSIGNTIKFQETKGQLNRVSYGIDSFITTFDETLIGINDISEVIRSIGKQITMFALNAGIEAARAGEKGIGFEIVASNLKRLAQHANNSTVGIKELISKISTNAKQEISTITESMNVLSIQLDKSYRIIRNIQAEIDLTESKLDRFDQNYSELANIVNRRKVEFDKFKL